MELKEAIRQVCVSMNVEPDTVLRRGKPSPQGKIIREKAQRLCNGETVTITGDIVIRAPAPTPSSNEPVRIGGPNLFLGCSCSGKMFPYAMERELETLPSTVVGSNAPVRRFRSRVVHFECDACQRIFIDLTSVTNRKRGTFRCV